MKKIIIISIIVLSLVWLFYNFRTASRNKSKTPINYSDYNYAYEYEKAAPPPAGENSIFVSDQKPADFAVIAIALIKNGGYVAIRQMGPERKPGALIGNSQYIPSPGTENLIIKLDRPVLHGEKLFAVLHEDNGDRIFGFKDDHELLVNEQPVIMRFMMNDFAE